MLERVGGGDATEGLVAQHSANEILHGLVRFLLLHGASRVWTTDD